MLSAFRHPFLRALPPDHALLGEFELEPLSSGQRLYERGDQVEKLYFVESGLVSVFRHHERRGVQRTIQAWCHGGGGRSFVGAYGVFLPQHISRSEYRVVVPGTARVVARQTMRELMAADSNLETLTSKIVQILNSAMQQMTLCHSWHTTEEQIATQLLILRYALGADRIPISRQVLADMVGCSRESTYKQLDRGDSGVAFVYRAIRIDDAEALREQSCGCFDAIMGERDSFLCAAD